MISLNCIFTLILGCVVGYILYVSVKHSKRKKYSEKTPIEKLSSVFKANLQKRIQELANNARTPEVIEYEIEQELNHFYEYKKEEAKTVLETYRKAIQVCEQSKRLLVNNIDTLNNRLKDSKERYKNALADEKQKILNVVEYAIAAKNNATKCLENTKCQIDTLNNKKNEVINKIELFTTSFSIKKVEIFTHIANIKAASMCNIDFNTNFNIDSLVNDLDMTICAKEDNETVDRIFNSTQNEDILTSIEITNEVKLQAADFLKN